ncbi:hypothetical protein NUU61_004868 [Penicillium alfredii]|uniref:Seipin n=1 Tax=Penicillium alfredii TaxID=1506179 RepID=A0A9W9F8P7_9EURO|nr:uncharacterized protein NUU61_004868 [Penicillium alfredii]KAJ5095512.1 hypothetical protein NUU61_004868 [Penicillium alfredii]
MWGTQACSTEPHVNLSTIMADSEYADDESEYDSPSSSRAVVMDAFLAPLRALISKSALRVYVNTLLFLGAALLLFGVSGFAYGVFYLRFIPTVGLEREVHLQFGTDSVANSDGHPWGTASVDSKFVSLQPYDVAVTLELPRTPSNLDTGNFMVDLALFSRPAASVLPGSTNALNRLSHSRRPAILTYTSPLVDVARRLARLPLYVVGWRREAEMLEVPMMEKVEFQRGARNLPQSLRLEIQSDGKMQVYSARVEFRAQFTGLRYFMYRWKLTSFVVFSSVFWSLSLASAGATWLLLTWALRPQETPESIKAEPRDLIKEEPEEDSSSDESVVVKKEEPDSTLVKSYPVEGDESGIGSGLESAEARGVQKRRSHLTQDGD